MAVKVGDIGVRLASAVVLAPAAVLAIWAGGLWFLALILLACAVLAVEWAMMSAARAWRVMAAAVGFGLVAGVVAAHAQELSLALVMLVFGAVAAGLFARNRGEEAVDAAYGVLYLGWPAVLLIWLRDLDTSSGLAWTVSAFAIAWASDIMAYLVGSAVGGPNCGRAFLRTRPGRASSAGWRPAPPPGPSSAPIWIWGSDPGGARFSAWRRRSRP